MTEIQQPKEDEKPTENVEEIYEDEEELTEPE